MKERARDLKVATAAPGRIRDSRYDRKPHIVFFAAGDKLLRGKNSTFAEILTEILLSTLGKC